jgi:putative ABC transport system substrate-binding protein
VVPVCEGSDEIRSITSTRTHYVASAENDPEVQARIAAFRQRLETLGWVENSNIQVEHRFSAGDFAQIQPHTAELVSSAPDLIVGSGIAVIAALKQATHSIPIVFNMVVDPVGQGLIVSLARPAVTSPASHSST